MISRASQHGKSLKRTVGEENRLKDKGFPVRVPFPLTIAVLETRDASLRVWKFLTG